MRTSNEIGEPLCIDVSGPEDVTGRNPMGLSDYRIAALSGPPRALPRLISIGATAVSQMAEPGNLQCGL